jgi:hypothetical protein
MSEDLAFRIQLGVILPKIREKMTADMTEIAEDVVRFVSAGSQNGETIEVDPIKEMIIKDLEIFLSGEILPAVMKKYTPAPEAAATESSEEAEAE